jgi:predicted nucleic acid-binding protein
VICVDTSVWVEGFRHPNGEHAVLLRRLLDEKRVLMPAPVRVELLAGMPAALQARMRADLSALPLALPGAASWERIESWLPRAAAAGQRFGVADLLIASLAVDERAELWSLDRDFRRMAGLGMVMLYAASEL